jgi:murein DD-endopeptidase MepM/ murein hydrolase activator NlpD
MIGVMRKFLFFLVVFAVICAAGAYWWAGRAGAPVVKIEKPGAVMGRAGTVELTVDAPGGRLSKLDVLFEQGGSQTPLFTLSQQANGTLKQDGPDRVRVTVPITRKELPKLKSGDARIVVNVERRALYDLRKLPASATRDLKVRLEPPQVGVLSLHHFVNLGGSEFVVFRAAPADVAAGVRVGDKTYRAYPGSAVGIADPAVRVAVYALLYDQDANTPMTVFATDPAGNTSTAAIDSRVFPKAFRRSRIEIPDTFLQRAVPAILQNSPDFAAEVADPNDLLAAFLKINSEMRRRNAATIASFAEKSAPQMLWQGTFQQLGNSQVESAFADHRTYFHDNKEIDQQFHLGFDLAVTAHVPIVAAARGRVVHAAYLGIYGNCVIVDHGLGVQSLYAHLSTLDVKPGDTVEKGQALGRSGMTGLAGGDHLHFTMLVGGYPVTPVDWWSEKWLEDRIYRKIREAGGKVG